MDDVMRSVGDGSMFLGLSSEGHVALNIAAVLVAVTWVVIIYVVGTIFFLQSPSIAAGIAGGASSGGHGFLQTGANMMANRLMFKRATQNNKGKGGADQKGGSATRS